MTDQNIPGYRNCEWVGSGDTGSVFRTICAGDDGAVRAVKRFNAMAIDRDFLARNFRRLSDAPPHPGLILVHEFHLDQSPYYVALEWLEDVETLADRPEPMDETEAWPLLYQVADSLSHLHRHRVRHGNLHPGNVFLTTGDSSGRRARLTDFGSGLAGNFHHLDMAENAWFAPPEQLGSPGRYRDGAMERWDVYRFGALAYWLIAGDMPRGHRCLELLHRAEASGSSRRVTCDRDRLAADLREHPEYEWLVPAQSRADQLRRGIIDQCLAIDPSERPADMREVHATFQKLELQFELEEAQVQVCAERTRQLGKLCFARALAACLAAGLLAVSVFLIVSMSRNGSLYDEVGALDAVVDRQKETIDDYERRWTRSLADRREFRSVAGSIFSQMSKAGASPGEERIERDVLERSRSYFVRALGDLGESASEQRERAGCLHSLAHVEAQLGHEEEARTRYREAATLFETLSGETGGEDPENRGEIGEPLLDCYERLAGLIGPDPGSELLGVLEKGARLFAEIRRRNPDDGDLAAREAAHQLALGLQRHVHGNYGEAIRAFALAGEAASGLRAARPDDSSLSELLSRIQFHAALSLREAERYPEAIDSFLAAMESVSASVDGRPYSNRQRRRLGMSYAHLGELFAEHAESEETRSHFNEAVRLLTPICEGGFGDPEAAICLSRSMAHLSQLERKASHWADSYRMSLAAIENLEATLENFPGDVDCRLTLSDLRIPHTETLRYNRKAALRCLDNGLTMIGAVQDQVEKDTFTIEPVRRSWQARIAEIFERYRPLCESFGENEKARMCSDRASRARELLAQGT